MSPYKTEKEAEYARQGEVIRRMNEFCPIINGFCRSDCVCFNGGRIYKTVKPGSWGLVGSVEDGDTMWSYYSPSCTNVLISGEMIVSGGN